MVSSMYMLQIPKVDKVFFDTLVKKMGWSASSIDVPAQTMSALNDAHNGKTTPVSTDNIESFIKSME